MNRAVDEAGGKIQPEHLERKAYVYVRQSSPYQVEHHREGRRRQYDLVDWAAAAGWAKDRVVVVDEDQGQSGTVAHARSGFERLAAAVARGEAGIVISLEVSRLARNSPDWHHLMYVCRWTRTLMADEHAVYDLALGADRMVLGLRGQMSEMELDQSIHRMVEARWNKARRGEVMTVPPAGYEIDDRDQWVIARDEAVVQAIRTVFAKFAELGSARQVWRWWREQGLKLPVRRVELRSRPVVWMPPAYRTILQVLRHPIYAGAYVFGRSQTVRVLDGADGRTLRVRRVMRPRGEWPVLIRDHHDAYIAFEQYLENQARMGGNRMMASGRESSAGGERGAAREGRALLQGLVRCGRCGRPMLVSYGGARAGQRQRTLQYRCRGARPSTGGAECQLVGGKRIDAMVVQVFLEASTPGAIEAGLHAAELVREECEAVERAWALQIEQAVYEAERAARQFHAVEPENRLVARELERRWNARLGEVEALQAQAAAAQQREQPLSEAERARVRELSGDLEAVWSAVTTTDRDRKRLLRCLIEEVQLCTEARHYGVRIVWKGGAVSDRTVVRLTAGKGHATAEDTVELVRQLAREFDDAQIARVLNKQGRTSGFGHAGIWWCPRRTRRPVHGRGDGARAGREHGHRAPLAACRRAGGGADDSRRAVADRAERSGEAATGRRRCARRLGRAGGGIPAAGAEYLARYVLGQDRQARGGARHGRQAHRLENQRECSHLWAPSTPV